jgi:hypothetical protein
MRVNLYLSPTLAERMIKHKSINWSRLFQRLIEVKLNEIEMEDQLSTMWT